MKERKAFGKRLDEFQALQFRLADMATALEASRTLFWRAAAALDAKTPDATQLCAMAKRFVTDACFEVANQALQLHGGYGYLVGIRHREDRARSARASDSRRHQRDHAPDHRKKPGRTMSAMVAS